MLYKSSVLVGIKSLSASIPPSALARYRSIIDKMHYSYTVAVTLMTLTTLSGARPGNGAYCSSVRSAVTHKSDQSAATEFCKTWLGISTTTVTSHNATATKY